MNAIDPSTDSRVERRVRDFLHILNSAGGPPLETLAPAEARQVLAGAQAGAALPSAEVEQKTISQDGLEVSLHIVRPSGAYPTELRPAFLFIHGGGWILGDFPTHERFVRDLVADTGYTAIFVNYTPSPEVRYPTAIHEIHAAAKWVAAHGPEIGVDASRLAIAGNSAGGNMSAAVSLLAAHEGGPEFRAQVLFWPVTDASFDTGSYHEFASGYFLSRGMMQWFWDAYTTDPAQRQEIYASPLQATASQLRGQPPALVQVAGADVLRDEGLAYANNLDAAGVDVTLVRYESMVHDFGLLNALSEIPAVRDSLHQAAEFLRKHLG
ncbi:MAG: alpha/beta hydrolase [Akkermansiaceae bacterium]|nr:alpha/beta hydrolase [Akkermansiaceae bacterium]